MSISPLLYIGTYSNEGIVSKIIATIKVERLCWLTGLFLSLCILRYSGDPELYHAKFVAVCQQSTDSLTPTDVVQIARLASNVKKTALMCNVDPDSERVTYTKLDYNPG